MINSEILKKYNLDKEYIKSKCYKALVDVYGYTYRDIIASRLDNIIYNAYYTIDDFTDCIEKKYANVLDEMTEDFRTIVVDIDLKYLLTSSSICKYKSDPIAAFGELDSYSDKNSIIKKRCRLLNTFGFDVDTENYYNLVETGVISSVITKLEGYYKEYNNLFTKFYSLKKELEKEIEYVDNVKVLETKFNTEVKIEFYEEILYLLNEIERNKLKEVISDLKTNSFSANDSSYYCTFGMEKGLITTHICEVEIENIRLKYKQKFDEKILLNTGSYPLNKELIESSELLVKSEFDHKKIIQREVGVEPSVSIKDKKLTVTPLIHLDLISKDKSYVDIVLVDQLCHAVETNMKIDGEFIYLNTGFESFEYKNTGFEFEEKKTIREYKELSDNINLMIAKEVTKKLHDSNIYIFGDENQELHSSKTTENNNIFTKLFYETYKLEIKHARITGNLDILFNKVGKENFDLLSNIMKDSLNISTSDIMKDKLNNIDSPLVDKYNKLILSSLEVNEKMSAYKSSNCL